MSQIVDRDCCSWRAVRTDLALPFSLPLPRLTVSCPSLFPVVQECPWWSSGLSRVLPLLLLPRPVRCIFFINSVDAEPSSELICYPSAGFLRNCEEETFISLNWARALSCLELGSLGRFCQQRKLPLPPLSSHPGAQEAGHRGFLEFFPRSIFPWALWTQFLHCFAPFHKDTGALERHAFGRHFSCLCLHGSTWLLLAL